MDYAERIRQATDEVEKLILLGAWLTEEAEKRGIRPPVVVGGSAVEIYTLGYYKSGDIDLVGPREFVKEVLLSSGYFREEGRFLISDELGLFVEVPDDRLDGSYEKVREVKVPELGAKAYVIGIEDLVIDRLKACVFWKSEDDCLWAKYLLEKYREEIDLNYLKERAKEDKVVAKLEDILRGRRGRDARKRNRPQP